MQGDDEDEDGHTDTNRSISWKLRALLMFILMWHLCFTISDAAIVALILFLCRYFGKLSHCYDGLKELLAIVRSYYVFAIAFFIK